MTDGSRPVRLRELYRKMFKIHKLLPSELAKQDPAALFYALTQPEEYAPKRPTAGFGWMAGL